MSSSMVNPYTAAAESGQCVVVPGPREAFLDIDNDADHAWMLAGVKILSERSPIVVTRNAPSKRGLPHRHVTLAFDHDIGPIERIALQAALGSDRKREVLSILRVWSNASSAIPATVFFEPLSAAAGLPSPDDTKF